MQRLESYVHQPRPAGTCSPGLANDSIALGLLVGLWARRQLQDACGLSASLCSQGTLSAPFWSSQGPLGVRSMWGPCWHPRATALSH